MKNAINPMIFIYILSVISPAAAEIQRAILCSKSCSTESFVQAGVGVVTSSFAFSSATFTPNTREISLYASVMALTVVPDF